MLDAALDNAYLRYLKTERDNFQVGREFDIYHVP